MKFLIWFLCIFAYALIKTLIKETGVMLGGIPTVILVGVTILLARLLCEKWDEHKENKEAIKPANRYPKSIKATIQRPSAVNPPTPQTLQYNTVTDKICFCRKCGSKVIDDAIFAAGAVLRYF